MERALFSSPFGNNELGLPAGTFAAVYDTDDGRRSTRQLPATAGWSGGVPGRPGSALSRSQSEPWGSPLMTTVPGTSGTWFRLFAQAVQAVPGGIQRVFVDAIPLNGVTGTAHRLLALEVLVSCAILVALAAAAWLTVRIGLRPLEQMAETAGEIAGGRPEPAGRGDRRPYRGGPAWQRTQCDARPDRDRISGTGGLRGSPQALRGGRLPRTADASHLDQGLRGAVPARPGRPPRRSRHRHAPDRQRVDTHGRARRRPVAARPPRPGTAAGKRQGRPRHARRRRGPRRPRHRSRPAR